MGIKIKITDSKIGGDANILNGSRLTPDSSVDIFVEGSDGANFNVANDSTNPNIKLHMRDTSVRGSVNVAQGATNPKVKADIHNVSADEINIPGTPTEDTTHRKTESYDTGFTGGTYYGAYKKATSHPEKAHNNDLFGAIFTAIFNALNPNKDDKSIDK